MNLQISANCQAILLLTAPLLVGKAGTRAELLRQSEYNELTKFLIHSGWQPSDLLNSETDALKHACHLFAEGRLERLLGRGFQLAQALDYWSARSVWIVSRADSRYPKRIKSRLKHDAPPVLYGCGNIDIAEHGGLAVVGSRNADDEVLSYAQHAGECAAGAGRSLISGGAKGVDSAAMEGAAALGGTVCNVMAEGLASAAISRRFRDGLRAQRTLLISPYDPSAGFNVGHAIARNKFIFALADIGLVVNSDLEKGGTWAGAIEQLRKLHFVPLFIRSSGKRSAGLDALLEEGALPWPNPRDAQALESFFAEQLSDGAHAAAVSKQGSTDDGLTKAPARGGQMPLQTSLLDEVPGHSPVPGSVPTAVDSQASKESATALSANLKGELYATFGRLIRSLLRAPMKVTDIADELDINKMQARDWLDRLVDEGVVEKKKSDATYRLVG